ncbi:MAG: exo-alpha-sialidase [Pirellulales bacterium]|nr:exo-alpha-sialidase [Pirellulales bacterium]
MLAVGLLQPAVHPACAIDQLHQQVLFDAGDNGYHTFRIPGLVVSNSGALLAFAEGRYDSTLDRAVTDLVLRRSFDNGQTWQPLQVVVPGFVDELNLNNPTPIVDRVTGDIIMPYILDASRVFVTRSSDDGASWSAPEEITSQVKDPLWDFYAPGPGHAIQLSSGRLLVPSYHRGIDRDLPYAHAFWSDDHGTTWQYGESITGEFYLEEGSAVEMLDGSVVNLMRYDHDSIPLRNSAHSYDGGATWDSPVEVASLGNVNVQGSAIRLTDVINDDANRILYSTPYGSDVREKMSVLTSYDETESFVNPRTVYYGPSAYSDLAISPDQTINLLYERGRYNLGYNHIYQQIAFTQFDQQWLEHGPAEHVRWDFAEQAAGTPNPRDGSILDSSGYDMHATALGAPTYVPGAAGGDGRAMHFSSATDDCIVLDKDDTADFFDFKYGAPFSIEVMLRTNSHASGGFGAAGMIVGSAESAASSQWFLQIDNGQVRFFVRDMLNRARTLTGGTDLANGEWFKINAVRDTNDRLFKLYINGVLVAERSDDLLDILTGEADVMIGEWLDMTRSFDGDIDYISFSRSVFSPVAVPEPSSLVLLATGVFAGGLFCRRRRHEAREVHP